MDNLKEGSGLYKCIFCGKGKTEQVRLVGTGGIYICEACVENSHKLLTEVGKETHQQKMRHLPKPREIKHTLDEYVVGQERAKKILSVAVYNHYKRIFSYDKTSDVELQKSNILLVGPTGTGKTLLAQTLARLLHVPFAIADATTLTEAGYVGEDVENILLRLLQNADFDVKKAERGIIYIDEIDKISRKSDSPSITRDVSGEGVQQSLLKIIEGTVASVPPQGGRKHPQQEFIKMNTTDILFICGGTFDGIERTIESRMHKQVVGFGTESISKKDRKAFDYLGQIHPEDLIKFGIIPEFIGRIPVIATMHGLDKDHLVEILSRPKNSLVKQFRKIFSLESVDLDFTSEALRSIAEMAIKRSSGARGLRAIIEELMLDVMYDLPEMKNLEKCIVDEKVVKKIHPPIMIFKNQNVKGINTKEEEIA
ncbi:MAG: ATP-dependent protease ATP-binding subunit ClpX [Elusimicrobia bacterium RIFOXYA2_FULL_39_19]|nr:MAG: ATP-dependent protease ATP-binding subunit ClpX [Elusimicrobia bacterium RIFOXYA2_FULL_39_19]